MDFKIPMLKVGMTVEGTVIQVNDDAVYIDISQFTEGVIYERPHLHFRLW